MPTLIESMRIERQITPVQVASFIGVNLNTYWDLEWHDDEPWVLDVTRFIRLCILYRTSPHALLPPDAFSSEKKWLKLDYNEHGQIAIASTLKGYCEDIRQVAEEIGWEEEALDLWLSDEGQIGFMPLNALDDLCRYLNVSTSDVLDEFCSALG